ncbi:hypothetical protein A2Z22_04475 [Candidatus Woesebacteria bacterium RBG_16_34_12]|uniref:Uncharacterized protein n=1 Tax=Candidatus Woesebacteria bacterium RBG_16_34_12 TaxID=1802480 RepID=A0A1F7X9T0_9BACT|nr:MAG: hypothetical protein A2Z22_04475 [Candidatus Woesebacteria bacterium RBG_16_34_12]
MSSRKERAETQRKKAQIANKQTEHDEGRRKVVGCLALGIGAIATGGIGLHELLDIGSNRETPSDNSEFIREIEKLLDINKGMSRTEIVRRYHYSSVTGAPGWMNNKWLNRGFVNTRNQLIRVKINSKGEPDFAFPDDKRLEIKDHKPLQSPVQEVFSFGNNYIAVYGTQFNIHAFASNTDLLQPFLEEYNSDSPASVNVLHLSFHPPGRLDFEPVIVGDPPIRPEFTNNKYGLSQNKMHLDTSQTPPDITILRNDIFINTLNILEDAGFWGIEGESFLTETLANEIVAQIETTHEAVDLQQQLQGTTSLASINEVAKNYQAQRNEAPSTLVGMLARIDSEWGEIFLRGKKYVAFTRFLVSQAETSQVT